jgi:uncharacterized protein (DUF362 family)
MTSYIHLKKVINTNETGDNEPLDSIYKNMDLLKEYIKEISITDLNENNLRNKSILLKPNWVTHSKKESDEFCLRTHDSFILAALEVVLECNPLKVLIGDAPVQGCDWGKMISQHYLSQVKRLSEKYQIPVSILDFRRRLFDPYSNKVYSEQHPISDYLIFNLGQKSYLEPITSPNGNRFRVIHYNPDGFQDTHFQGIHKYCITKEVFKSDIIISLPKIKTHQRTGMTGALKNIVGLNGDKDFLPHHRLGGTARGGDCYAGKNLLRYWAELAQDKANRHHGSSLFRIWLKISGLVWKMSIPGKSYNLGAGWFGNDTTWRMVMDLNRIVLYGKEDGTIANEKQRTLFSLCDAIIGGQGNGPLRPEPFPMGFISFSNDSGLTDVCFGKLMGFDIDLVPLLRSANDNLDFETVKIIIDNQEVNLKELSKYQSIPVLPDGWQNYQSGKAAQL